MAPNCAHLSNPYHRCTQACSQPKTHTNVKKKTSGYGRSVTDGQLGKKVTNNHKRTYSGCSKASNPYHECDDNCYKRLSDSGAPPPLKFDRKNKPGSRPEPPVPDSVPASKVGAIYLSDAPSPISHYSDKNKVKTKNDENVQSVPISGQIHIPHVKPLSQKDEPKNGAEHLANPKTHEEKIASHKVVPITHVDDAGEAHTTSAAGSNDSSCSGIEEIDEGETESVISESRIQVGKYNIKESFASILNSIMGKYGDIGASCHLESVVMRSYYIECVCYVVQELQSASIMELSKPKVKELLAILKDVESAKLRVAWLRNVLDEIAENIEMIDQQQEVESLREKLQLELDTLAEKEKEVDEIKTRIPEIRDRLSELELKASELNSSKLLSIRSQVDNLHIKSLIDELL
ncbi:hypothetical protein RJT34_08113 [Clitoria ternatea]|uniref:Plant phospholipase-like protein n=1 Tax=Clitoria ternatea TaxID=43366 RepID=A0AAN9K427_CLITE